MTEIAENMKRNKLSMSKFVPVGNQKAQPGKK